MDFLRPGTGTPAPSLERQGSGYLVEIDDDVIVMDHGPGAHHRLLESGHRAVDVTHAFFTHLHYDHCMDYGRLVLQRWDQGADKVADLDVYGPPPIKRMTEQTPVWGEDLMRLTLAGPVIANIEGYCFDASASPPSSRATRVPSCARRSSATRRRRA